MSETSGSDEGRTERWIVSGRVQGVFYRAFTREAARELGLRGWVRNLPEGTVEARVTGAPEALDALERRLRQGPPASKVEAIQRQGAESAVPADEGFEIRY